MKTIDMVASGKGGVGKSYVCWLISQYRIDSGNSTNVIDTEPLAPVIMNFHELNPTHIKILKDGTIDRKLFDDMLMNIVSTNAEHTVIDTGASNFIEIMKYLINGKVCEKLIKRGYEFNIHVLVSAGIEMRYTLSGFKEMMQKFSAKGAKIVLWENEFWGPLVHEGKKFEDMKSFTDYKDKLKSKITLPKLDIHTSEKDIIKMRSLNLTFNEAMTSDKFNFVEQDRLEETKSNYYESMAEI